MPVAFRLADDNIHVRGTFRFVKCIHVVAIKYNHLFDSQTIAANLSSNKNR